MTEPINLGFCPRCKSDFPMMTKTINNVVFCHLCGCDLLDDAKSELNQWIRFAKEYSTEM